MCIAQSHVRLDLQVFEYNTTKTNVIQTMSIITPDSYDDFDCQKIVFEPAKQGSTPNGSKFSRIFVKYDYGNGKVDTLTLQTPVLFTWGINMGKSFNDNDTGTPQLGLASYNALNGPTDEQRKYMSICESILARIKRHLKSEDVKDELSKWDMDSDVNSMTLFYVKKERGKPIAGVAPVLYSKLYYSKSKDNRVDITTRIADATTGEDLPALPLLGPSDVYVALVFSNIFIGAKPSIQTRIGEVMVVDKKERTRYLKPMATAAPVPAQEQAEQSSNIATITKLKALKKQSKKTDY